jgi:hypothetical protein
MTASAALTLIGCGAAALVFSGSAAASTHGTRQIASTPVNPATISTDLKQQTGYSASQLTTKTACGAPKPGTMSCLARVLAIKSTGKSASLLHAPHATPMHVTQATRKGTLEPALTSAALGTSAPTAGTSALLQWAYDTTWLSAQNPINDTIAIIDAYDDPNALSDMATFRTWNGLPGCAVTTCFNQYNQNGQKIDPSGSGTAPNTDPAGGWEVEESLDLDAVSSLCPYCKIDLIEARNPTTPNLEAAVSTAHNLNANQISMSFGGPYSPDYVSQSGWVFSGVASLAAAGDDGFQTSGDVQYPAAYPGVTAVGGTTLDPDPSAPRGFDESAWSTTESGCDASQPIPTYQNGVTTNCNGRAYNDISADADPNTGLDVFDTIGGPEGCSGWCPVGGTSLATPLAAALEAVTGVSGTSSPSWTYSDASLLNDIVASSDGSCPDAFLLCNAAIGWDGPTGNGSINGDVVVGGPGVGGSDATGVNAYDVTLSGGVYPNGAATSYYWQYWVNGSSPAAGTQTSTPPGTGIVSGQTLQAVSTTLCNQLQPDTTYDYSLVATSGTSSEDGYDGSFTTAPTESTPTTSTNPSIVGTAYPGQTLTGEPGTWNDQSCNSTQTYQWQESDSPSGPWTTVSTSPTYALTSADLGKYLVFTSSETDTTANPPLTGTATSQVVGPVEAPATNTAPTPPTTVTTTTPTAVTLIPATMLKQPTFQARTTEGSTIAVNPGVYAYATSTIVQYYRCARGCTLLSTHDAWTYKLRSADRGRYIKVVITAYGASGTTPIVTTRWIGPITAPTAGTITISGTARIASAAAVKGSKHARLASVLVVKRTSKALTLGVTRAGKTAMTTWAYVLKNGAVVHCTVSHSLKHSVKLSVPVSKGESVKLVAVRA